MLKCAPGTQGDAGGAGKCVWGTCIYRGTFRIYCSIVKGVRADVAGRLE